MIFIIKQMPEYKEFLSIEEIAKDYAIRRHREVNHHYNALYPYAFHLQMTVEVAMKFMQIYKMVDFKKCGMNLLIY